MNHLTIVCRKVRLNGQFIIEGQVLSRYGAKVSVASDRNFEEALYRLRNQLRMADNDRILFVSKDVAVIS